MVIGTINAIPCFLYDLLSIRLSEPNLASISGQLEELYMANSRKDMNETLTDILMSACVTASVMPPRLMMEHILLVSILHNTVGIEVIFLCCISVLYFSWKMCYQGCNSTNNLWIMCFPTLSFISI